MFKLEVFEDSELKEEFHYNANQSVKIGRGSMCDIRLEPHPGISREHLQISFNESDAKVELISGTGRMICNSQNTNEVLVQDLSVTVSVPPYDFKITNENSKSQTPEISDEERSALNLNTSTEAALLVPETEDNESSSSDTTEEDFDFNEPTSVGLSHQLEYSIKVFKSDRFQQDLIIEGTQWKFGRDPESDFNLKSQGASRNHFSILKIGQNFYVKDLGSSNGTLLNKQQLPANQEIEMKSGDYIEVGDYKFIFEIKDVEFEEKLQEIALIEEHVINPKDQEDLSEIRSNALVLSDDILKLPSENLTNQKLTSQSKRTQFIRYGLLGFIGIFGAFYFYLENNSSLDQAELASLAQERALQKEKINAALDKFNLALRFYNESQFERCLLEIDEFVKFGIETEETAGAMELRNQCDIEKERMQRQNDLREQQQKRVALENQVKEIVDQCRPKISEGSLATKTCLTPAVNLDPSNEGISELLDAAQAVDLKKEADLAKRKAYLKAVSQGKSLYKKAEDYQKYGDWKRAIKAYNKFISSTYPDPKSLKPKAKRNLASIKSDINRTLQEALKDSKRFLNQGDYKKSILSANKGLDVNRDDVDLLKTKSEATKLLKTILRKYYQESIIEEDFGQIDEAKIKWKKILDLGVSGSDYVKKAKNKLKYYEEGV